MIKHDNVYMLMLLRICNYFDGFPELLEDGDTAWRLLPDSGKLPDKRHRIASASLDNTVFISGILSP